MAQTWPLKTWKVALLGAVDFVGRPVTRLLRRSSPEGVTDPKNILVIELWEIGDVVLATPFLAALRRCFPKARVTVLGKPHAEVLLRESGLANEVVVAMLPWAKTQGKYRPAEYMRGDLRALVGTLRAKKFDLAFDARMDIRSNVLSSLSGAARRVGFRYGGADWLLTDAVPVNPMLHHKADDWMTLLGAVGCPTPQAVACSLRVSENEKRAARALIERAFPAGTIPVAIHPGASHAGKRWPLENFAELTRGLSAAGYHVVVCVEPSGYGRELGAVPGVLSWSGGLRELMGLLSQCSMLVCNDSGPMHIAAALGVPTVAIFERGNPRWFGPVGSGHTVILGERAGKDLSAAPVNEPPRNPVSVERVRAAVVSALEQMKPGNASGSLH